MELEVKRIEGYQCQSCYEIIDKAIVQINYSITYDIEDLIDNGLDENGFARVARDEIEIVCPECGALLY